MDFIKTWFAGYYNPRRFADRLRGRQTPGWGFWATLLRALMNSLLLYLPLHLSGRTPPTPTYLTIFPTRGYYGSLVFVTPLVFIVQWLIGCSAVHVCLRLSNRPSDFDRLLDLSGMATLVIGAFIMLWDWLWIAAGGMNQYLLGTSHLVIDLWWIALFIVGLKRLMNVPYWLGILLSILDFIVELPLAILFMRSPF